MDQVVALTFLLVSSRCGASSATANNWRSDVAAESRLHREWRN